MACLVLVHCIKPCIFRNNTFSLSTDQEHLIWRSQDLSSLAQHCSEYPHVLRANRKECFMWLELENVFVDPSDEEDLELFCLSKSLLGSHLFLLLLLESGFRNLSMTCLIVECFLSNGLGYIFDFAFITTENNFFITNLVRFSSKHSIIIQQYSLIDD